MEGLIFMSWVLIRSLYGAKAGISIETRLPNSLIAAINMRLRTGRGDSNRSHWHPASQCPQKVCMICG